jgi:hypothetical protein
VLLSIIVVSPEVMTFPKVRVVLVVGLTPTLFPAGVLFNVNIAVTALGAFIVTTQVPVPEQPPPLQPANVEPVEDAAVRVTTVPLANDDWQVNPQSIPPGLLVTVPDPMPDFIIEMTELLNDPD